MLHCSLLHYAVLYCSVLYFVVCNVRNMHNFMTGDAVYNAVYNTGYNTLIAVYIAIMKKRNEIVIKIHFSSKKHP